MTPKTIALCGAFDTKGEDYAFIRQQIVDRGHNVLTVDTGILAASNLFPVDIGADEVARAGGSSLDALRQKRDRGQAMKVMSAGLPAILARLHAEGRIHGAFGMGGTGGSSVVSAGLRALPVGFPKLCLSTAAGGEVSAYVGTSDLAMMPSIVDVAGINRVSRLVYTRAAGAICGMVETDIKDAPGKDKPVIAASMFGNTTECVSRCVELLAARGFEVLVFHCTGTGGKAMEGLVRQGLVDAVLDITTTEWADTLCGGVFDAGPERLDAPAQAGIPHLIVPGCVDMANFGGPNTIPAKYKNADRLFYEWNPSVTLMRTNAAENAEMGRIFAEKANRNQAPVAILLPMRGVSILDGEGQPFCDWDADRALFDQLEADIKPEIPIERLDCNINDPAFAERAVQTLLSLIEKSKS